MRQPHYSKMPAATNTGTVEPLATHCILYTQQTTKAKYWQIFLTSFLSFIARYLLAHLGFGSTVPPNNSKTEWNPAWDIGVNDLYSIPSLQRQGTEVCNQWGSSPRWSEHCRLNWYLIGLKSFLRILSNQILWSLLSFGNLCQLREA